MRASCCPFPRAGDDDSGRADCGRRRSRRRPRRVVPVGEDVRVNGRVRRSRGGPAARTVRRGALKRNPTRDPAVPQAKRSCWRDASVAKLCFFVSPAVARRRFRMRTRRDRCVRSADRRLGSARRGQGGGGRRRSGGPPRAGCGTGGRARRACRVGRGHHRPARPRLGVRKRGRARRAQPRLVERIHRREHAAAGGAGRATAGPSVGASGAPPLHDGAAERGQAPRVAAEGLLDEGGLVVQLG